MLKKQIVSFILVGLLNTAFGYGVYTLFIYLGFNYVSAALYATIIGVFFNFKTIGKIVFGSNENGLIFKFIAVYVVVFIVNVLCIKIFKSVGFNDYIAGFLAIGPYAIVSFILNKKYVFRK